MEMSTTGAGQVKEGCYEIRERVLGMKRQRSCINMSTKEIMSSKD